MNSLLLGAAIVFAMVLSVATVGLRTGISPSRLSRQAVRALHKLESNEGTIQRFFNKSDEDSLHNIFYEEFARAERRTFLPNLITNFVMNMLFFMLGILANVLMNTRH